MDVEAVGLSCSPNAHEKQRVYPVAENNKTGSGSNEFCLAVLLHARTIETNRGISE